jgi:hypothetical protein
MGPQLGQHAGRLTTALDGLELLDRRLRRVCGLELGADVGELVAVQQLRDSAGTTGSDGNAGFGGAGPASAGEGRLGH